MDGNGALLAKTLFKIVAFHHAGNCVARGQLDKAGGVHLAKPGRVEGYLGLLGIKDLEDLLFVGFCVGKHLFFGEGRAGFQNRPEGSPMRPVKSPIRKMTWCPSS